ncbi:hypothetical protein PV11_00906 [Exophiala sideris]|uniref:Uncharacterized protein n=1 Tax=Exophiala sideris TaxID=1016849 RepID=A0A0D1XBA3_9EURO|nr:hypothetical protein PV11_00906 [Exophiala sideris]
MRRYNEHDSAYEAGVPGTIRGGRMTSPTPTSTTLRRSEESSSAVIGKVGDDVYLEPPLFLDYGCNIKLGDQIYANFNLTILDCSLVTIGNRVMFGPNVSIYAATHETDVQSRRDNIEYARPVTIGDDCWIGGSSIILPGVTIGQGCTVGAGSVVTKDVPAWSVVMGTPARVVKKVTPLDPLPAEQTPFTAIERMG